MLVVIQLRPQRVAAAKLLFQRRNLVSLVPMAPMPDSVKPVNWACPTQASRKASTPNEIKQSRGTKLTNWKVPRTDLLKMP
jgi:hypothetical protein